MKSKLVSVSVEAVYTQHFASLDDLKVGQCIEIWTPSNKKSATGLVISVPSVSDNSLCIVLLNKNFKPMYNFIRIPKEAAESCSFDIFHLTSIKEIGKYIDTKLDEIESELEFWSFNTSSAFKKTEEVADRMYDLIREKDDLEIGFMNKCLQNFYSENGLIPLENPLLLSFGYQDTIHLKTKYSSLDGDYIVCKVPGQDGHSIFAPYVLAKVVNGSANYSVLYEHYFKQSDEITKLP